MGSEYGFARIGVAVGLIAEARIARRLGCRVEIGGGTAEGAAMAAARLADSGVSALVSFGLAGGLDPALRPGAILVPTEICVDGKLAGTDAALSDRLGGATRHRLLAGTRIATTAAEKAALRRATGADAIDLETPGLVRVAQARGLPFAALRAVCDPAERSLPPAALAALDARGGIALLRVLQSLARRPAQTRALIALARDAAAARRALIGRVASVVRRPPVPPTSG